MQTPADPYPALRYLLAHAGERGLFPEERLELLLLLGKVARLEADGFPVLPRAGGVET